MAPAKYSSVSESGIGAEEQCDSAVGAFFNSYLNRLVEQTEKRQKLNDDPSFDMDDLNSERNLVVRTSSPINLNHDEERAPTLDGTDQSQNSSVDQYSEERSRSLQLAEKYPKHQNKVPSLYELEFLYNKFKQADVYSQKLTDIMLRGLNETLGNTLYQMFRNGELPQNWWPIVRMNDENTPYIEFIIKSDVSDQDLVQQLNEFTTEHMAICGFILEHLYQSANKSRCQSGGISSIQPSSRRAVSLLEPPPKSIPRAAPKVIPSRENAQEPQILRQKQQSQQASSQPPVEDELVLAADSHMSSNPKTPKSENKKAQPLKRPPSIKKPQLENDNMRRVLPHRSCKSKSMTM